MTTNIGNPPIQPDNVLLDLNSSTGLLELKPGTQGDILYAKAAGVWDKLPAGTAGYALLTQGAGANPAWSNPSSLGEWTLLQTLSPAGVTNITSAALTAYSEYKVKWILVGSNGDNVQVQFNNDAGANYYYVYTSGTAVANASGANALFLGRICNNMTNLGEVQVCGLTPANASGGVNAIISAGFGDAVANNTPMRGLWIGGNQVQISSMKFSSNGGVVTFTGKIEIWGRSP